MNTRKGNIAILIVLIVLIAGARLTRGSVFTENQIHFLKTKWAKPVTTHQVTISWAVHGTISPGPCQSHRWVMIDLFNPNPYFMEYDYPDYYVVVEMGPIFTETRPITFYDIIQAGTHE